MSRISRVSDFLSLLIYSQASGRLHRIPPSATLLPKKPGPSQHPQRLNAVALFIAFWTQGLTVHARHSPFRPLNSAASAHTIKIMSKPVVGYRSRSATRRLRFLREEGFWDRPNRSIHSIDQQRAPRSGVAPAINGLRMCPAEAPWQAPFGIDRAVAA